MEPAVIAGDGRFLSCDDLGPLGRIVAPGETEVMDPLSTRSYDYDRVVAEREWIMRKKEEADSRASGYRRRLKTAHMGGNRDAIREWFEIWTIEAAKYDLCERWLLAVVSKLEQGESMAMSVPKDFSWDGYGPMADLTGKLLAASDREIMEGTRFRAK